MTVHFLLRLFKAVHWFPGKTTHFAFIRVLAFQRCWKMVALARLSCFLLQTSSWQCWNDFRDGRAPSCLASSGLSEGVNTVGTHMSSLKQASLSHAVILITQLVACRPVSMGSRSKNQRKGAIL